MKRIVRLTERDLSRIIRRVIKEDAMGGFVNPCQAELDALKAVLPDLKSKMPPTCMTADGQKQCVLDLLKVVTDLATSENLANVMDKYYAIQACQKEKGVAKY